MSAVSIVINNYNYAEYVGQAIESALAQTHIQTEVIVVDDGSTDDSRAVIERYKDRVRPIFKENGGQASAFNAGLSECNGDIVIFLDADDLLLSDTVARVVDRFRQRPDAAKVHYRLELIDACGRRMGVCTPAVTVPLPEGDVRRRVLTAPDDVVHPPASGNAYAAWVLRELFPLPVHGPTDADRYLLNLAALVGPLASLDGIGGCYRVHGRNWFAHSAGVQLGQIRHTITVTAATHEEIRQLASRRGLARGDSLRLSSVTDLAQRLISLRLEPELHPFPGDWRARLAWEGIVTTLRRSDLSRRRRALYAAWFAAMAVLPSPAPAWLAERLFEAWRLGNIAIPLPKG